MIYVTFMMGTKYKRTYHLAQNNLQYTLCRLPLKHPGYYPRSYPIIPSGRSICLSCSKRMKEEYEQML